MLWQLIRREIDSRYRQNWMGGVWLILTPLATLLIMTVVFRQIMGVRWHGIGHEEAHLTYALRLYAGLAIFQFFSDCVSRSPTLVLAQPQLVKKVVFPLELLAWVNLGAALLGLCVSALLLLIGVWMSTGDVPYAAISLPLIWLPLLPLLLGLGWLLSGLGTYVRDVGHVVGPLLSALMFLSPIFFPVDALPPSIRAWMAINPIAAPITQTRHVLMDGTWPDWSTWGIHLMASCCFALLGAWWFSRVRKGFADVL